MPFTEKLFTTLWQSHAEDIDERLRSLKREMFAGVSGVVVEVGPGTGVNLKYFPRNITWWGVEPNQEFRMRLPLHPEIPRRSSLFGGIESVASESADAAISTIVLCSVKDLPQFLREVRRVLKPGGVFLSIEHVGAPKGSPKRLLQQLIKPFTSFAGGGCEPDRDIEDEVRKIGFSTIERVFADEMKLSRLPFDVPILALRAVK